MTRTARADRVIAYAADQFIRARSTNNAFGARTATDRDIARASDQCVGPTRTIDHIVAGSAADVVAANLRGRRGVRIATCACRASKDRGVTTAADNGIVTAAAD